MLVVSSGMCEGEQIVWALGLINLLRDSLNEYIWRDYREGQHAKDDQNKKNPHLTLLNKAAKSVRQRGGNIGQENQHWRPALSVAADQL